MKKQLFTYAVILHKRVEKEGNKTFDTISEFESSIIIEPTNTLAKDEKDVVFKVTRLIPEEFAGDPDNVEILVRPF